MWNDKETDIDLLGYEPLAKTIKSLVMQAELCPLTIGIFGNWGAGKSSVLKMVEKELKADASTACINFNGWLFQGYDDTKAVVMETIVSELIKQRPTSKKLQEKAKQLFKRVDWLKLARHGAGLAFTTFTGIPDPGLIAAITSKVSSIFNDPSHALTPEQLEELKTSITSSIKERGEERTVPEEISAFRKEFEELLKTAKVQRLVVLVDDLDRCMPETAIAVLEAIRLFLYVPGTIFLIAADENMIAYAVRKHFPDLPASVGPSDYTRNYLEKLIQVPFRIPPLGKTETRTYVTLLLGEFAMRDDQAGIEKLLSLATAIFSRPWEGTALDEKTIQDSFGKIPEPLKEALALSNRISNALAEGLNGNPRQVKRFLNTLMVRLRMAEAHGIGGLINRDMLAKMMLLERFNEGIYTDVFQSAAQSRNGSCEELAQFEEFIKTGNQEAAEDLLETIPTAWKENQWLRSWCNIEPTIRGVDLRPYFYISREKSPGFSTDVGLSSELNTLAEKLATGNRLLISNLTGDLAALSPADATRVFQYLSEGAKERSDWKQRPKEIEGVFELCKSHPVLQNELVSLFENLPVSELGPWIVAGNKSVITESTARERFDALLDAWEHQDSNASLRMAVEQLRNL